MGPSVRSESSLWRSLFAVPAVVAEATKTAECQWKTKIVVNALELLCGRFRDDSQCSIVWNSVATSFSIPGSAPLTIFDPNSCTLMHHATFNSYTHTNLNSLEAEKFAQKQ